MEKELKLSLGKILGEVYRIQKHTQGIECSYSDATIYGLLNGIEMVVDEHICKTQLISDESYETVVATLTEIYLDQEKLENFSGFHEIEHILQQSGVDTAEAKTILTHLYKKDQFTKLIDKMDIKMNMMTRNV